MAEPIMGLDRKERFKEILKEKNLLRNPCDNPKLIKRKEVAKKHKKVSIDQIQDVARASSILEDDLSSFAHETLNLPTLLEETATILETVVGASGMTLYLVDSTANEIYDIHDPANRWRMEEGTTIAAFVACQREYIMLEDIVFDKRFPLGINEQGYFLDIKSLLCIPVVTPDGECYAVVEIYRGHQHAPFSRDDLKIAIVVTGWMGAAFHQNRQRVALQKQQALNEALLEITKRYFQGTLNIEKMVSEIINLAKITVNAERGVFIIVDNQNGEMIGDIFEESVLEGETSYFQKNVRFRLDNLPSIAGDVAKTGVVANIPDVYEDPRFNSEIDRKSGYTTRSVLCMPVRGVGKILGVLQMINKKNGGYFSISDENFCKTFTVYFALALHYAKLNKQLETTEKFNKVYVSLLKRQMQPCIHDVQYMFAKPFVKVPTGFNEFKWYIQPELYSDMPQLVLQMVLEIVGEEEVYIESLMRFILTTRKLYRDVPYHNYEHAFTVCHCMYNVLKRNLDLFTTIEKRALIIAALCHDIDHGGFTNNYLVLTNDILVQLYEESPWENHHVKVTMTLLDEYNIYKNLSFLDHKIFRREIKEAIIATDLALYFRGRSKLLQVVTDNNFDFANNSHRQMLKSIMMTVCDLSGQCKPFSVAERITSNIYREFYHQGDMEKSLGLTPLPIIDRDKRDQQPLDQVNFLGFIVMPATDLLKTILPNTVDLYMEALNLRRSWQEILEIRAKDRSHSKAT